MTIKTNWTDEDEERMEVIGQNGNDGSHYNLTNGNEIMKKTISGKNLELVGWYDIPRIKIKTSICPVYFDIRPSSRDWIATHPNGYLIKFSEPEHVNTIDNDSGHSLVAGDRYPALQDIEKVSPSGVAWLNESELLTSGRKSYRSGMQEGWIAKINIDTGVETNYTIKSEEDTKAGNFHMMQAMGGGFVRDHANDRILIGKGGYDVLGSPLGPALASWNIGDEFCNTIIDYKTNTPAPRDPYYVYPCLDENTSSKSQLPMWRNPINGKGFWQGGSGGDSCFINHPVFEGFIYAHNFGRGLLDYRAQGDAGSSSHFLVKHPKTFYDGGDGANRGGHKQEVVNAAYPDGQTANTLNIISLSDMEGSTTPDVKSFDWPRFNLEWCDHIKRPTHVNSLVWDDDRQLLWATIGNTIERKLVAYKLIDDDSKPEPPLTMSDELKDFFNVSTDTPDKPELTIQEQINELNARISKIEAKITD